MLEPSKIPILFPRVYLIRLHAIYIGPRRRQWGSCAVAICINSLCASNNDVHLPLEVKLNHPCISTMRRPFTTSRDLSILTTPSPLSTLILSDSMQILSSRRLYPYNSCSSTMSLHCHPEPSGNPTQPRRPNSTQPFTTQCTIRRQHACGMVND